MPTEHHWFYMIHRHGASPLEEHNNKYSNLLSFLPRDEITHKNRIKVKNIFKQNQNS